MDSFAIITARDVTWNKVFEKVGKEKSICVERYAIKKEKDIFDTERLSTIVEQLNKEYELKTIDQNIYDQCKKYEWAVDFVQGYKTYEEYRKYGLGIVAIHNGDIVSGASSYSSYIGGIEVEADTEEDYRRKGLATVCAAIIHLDYRNVRRLQYRSMNLLRRFTLKW